MRAARGGGSTSPMPPRPPSGCALPAPAGRLELERVVYAHDRARPPLIKDVSFVVEPGESLGIVGASGSGKTTLLRLLLGVWQPQRGAVRLDGADIAHWDRDALGQHVGYLPQDVALFAGTVAREHRAPRRRSIPSRWSQAAQLAQAHEMILRLPDGYDTEVGDGGARAVGRPAPAHRAGARAVRRRRGWSCSTSPNANLDAEGEARARMRRCVGSRRAAYGGRGRPSAGADGRSSTSSRC